MNLLIKENNDKSCFKIECICSHCIIISYSKKSCDNNKNKNLNEIVEKKKLLILQKKNKIFNDFINLTITHEILKNIPHFICDNECNENSYCHYYESLIKESLNSLNSIELPLLKSNSSNERSYRRQRRRQFNDMNISRTFDYQQRLLLNQQYSKIEKNFKILIVLLSYLFKWDWVSDIYNNIITDFEHSKLFSIVEQLCNIPLLELTSYPSLYRKLFTLYKNLVLYGLIQPLERHRKLAGQVQNLVTSAQEFLNMVEPVSTLDISKDGLISLSQEITNDWNLIVY